MKTLFIFAFTALLLTLSCASPGVQNQTRNTANSTQEAPDATQNPVSSPDSGLNPKLAEQINQIAAESKGKVGVSVMALETGEILASLNPQERFPMQSVYKLPISMAVMKQVEAGKFKLSDKIEVQKSEMIGRRAHSPIRDRHPNGTSVTIEQLMWFAIGESDGTASDVLMRIAGGPSAIQAYLTELGIKDMIVLDTEQTFSRNNTAQYRNWTTPEAAVALLRALYERRGLSEANQALLLKFMTESKPGKKRLKGMLPEGTLVAHKTGTSGTDKGVTAATNDIGIITLPNGKRVAIAVFVSESPADEATREGVIAKIALAAFQAAGKP
jgi:beta-lactamase class A